MSEGTPDSFTTFGAMLRFLRLRARLTQDELGIAVGYSGPQIARLESGRRLPDPPTVQAVFIPALGLEHDPDAARGLIALAAAARGVDLSSPRMAAQRTDPYRALPGLPRPLTRFIGREREVREVRRLLDTNHLITLTGSGGVGKTRLAIEVGAVWQTSQVSKPAAVFDETWLVELAALADPELVPQAVAAVFGLPELPSRDQVEGLATHLAGRRLLLIMDNCEHLVTACAQLVEALLSSCPELHILATSREPLRVPGEVTWRVPSLTTPDPARLPPINQAAHYEAVQLFVEHASAALPGYNLTPSNLAAVAQICARLDGIPLAIEMAAAQISALPVEEIAAGLDYRFALLTTGRRTALPRQQTLRATLDWGYDQLTEPERRLLARLSLFAGGWTVDAAQAVCADEGVSVEIGRSAVLPLMLQLVHKSLVVTMHRGGQARYTLLETVRLYASEKLDKEAVQRLQDRHLEYFLGVVQGITDIDGAQVDAWLRRIDPEEDNLRLALAWACTRADDAERALRLAAALRAFWLQRTRFTEGLAWLERALARGAGAPAAARAWALCVKGHLLVYLRDNPRALSSLEASLAVFRKTGDQAGTAWCLGTLAELKLGSLPRAMELAAEALALFRKQDSLSGMARVLRILGIASFQWGDVSAAVHFLEDAVTAAQMNGAHWYFGFCLDPLSVVNPERAIELCKRELDHQRQAGNEEGIATLLSAYGGLLFGVGEYERARWPLDESVLKWEQMHRINHWSGHALLGLGEVALSQGQVEQALELFARYERDSREAGVTYGVYEARFHASTARLAQGDLALSVQLVRGCLEWFYFHTAADRRPIVCCLIQLAHLASRSACPRRACVVLGATRVFEEGVDKMSGASVASYFRHWHLAAQRGIVEPTLAAARACLGDGEYAAAWAEGQHMTLEQAVAAARALEGGEADEPPVR